MSPSSGFSVVIPLFNKEASVARAIDSVLNQGGGRYEVIVVDDGSTDGSADVVFEYGSAVRYLRQANAGPSVARNYGARLSKFDLLLFLDADDELLPGCLDAHLACRNAHSDALVSLASFQVMQGGRLVRQERFPDRISGLPSRESIPLAREFSAKWVIDVPSGAICMSRAAFASTAGFDPQLRCWEITDFMLRLALNARPIALIHDIKLTIHEDPQNSQFQRSLREHRYMYRFASKLVDTIPAIPKSEREPFVKQIGFSLYGLWDEGAIPELQALASRAHHILKTSSVARLCYLRFLPAKLVSILSTWRKARDYLLQPKTELFTQSMREK